VFRSFVKELHEQLMSCMNYFTDQLQKYRTFQVEKINRRDATLRTEMTHAQQLVDDIELLLKSPASVSVGGREIVNRCEEFFESCIDSSQCETDFSYLDFIPAGRLYVKTEHLGYFRLCDALPEDLELKLGSSVPAVRNREYKVVIQTNHSNCTDAERNLDVLLTDDQGGPVPFEIVNNNDGSYSVVFVPRKPGMLQLNVRLFGVTVSSSPLEISVADEVVTPKRMTEPSAANVSSSNSLGLRTSSEMKSDMSADYLRDNPSGSSARKHAAPCVENFDDSNYFVSPHSAMEASPGNAVPSKQTASSLPDSHVDVETVTGCLMTMNMAANSREENCLLSPGVCASAATCSTPHSYANSTRLEFEDSSYGPDNEFQSSGLNLQLSYFEIDCFVWFHWCCWRVRG